ncbi:MAG: toxin, partial [Spirochaetia bacterium]|nr:toxin [Spirochaetia bacterium]
MQNRQEEKVGKGATPAPESKRSGAGGKGQENREDHFSIQIPQISLPKGGGAIKGIDEKFEVNAANGTASLSLPLPFSPGRNGFMPPISLGYNSGAGNGLFGLGWDLGYPSIQRKTDKKLPRYKDDEDSDTFMFSGVEDLVPFLKPEGGPLPQNIRWTRDERVEEGFTIRRYRPRLEGAFSRIERISHLNYGVWWKVTTRENVVTFYGKNPEFRIADPEEPSHIFQWLPELSFDDKGNCVLYEFKLEDGAGYGDDLFDANRFHPDDSPRFTNRYLKRVYYCPRTPFLPYRTFREQNRQIPAGAIYYTTNPVAENGFLMELVLDYGEHGDLPDTGQGTVSVRHTLDSNAPAWRARHDAFSSYRSGFDVRTARLCR